MDRVPTLVGELVHLKVDVLVATNFPAIQAAKEATKTIPIVMVATVDPVATGIVDSLARPGGNITGLTRLTQELSGNGSNCLRRCFHRCRASESFGMRIAHQQRLPLKSMRLGARTKDTASIVRGTISEPPF